MILPLTIVQLHILRRCDGGLRVWEVDSQLATLLDELRVVRQLGLVTFDESSGYTLTAEGTRCLLKLRV